MELGLVSNNHYIEYNAVYKNIEFVVLFNSGGYRTAYVDVSNTKFNFLEYWDCDNYINVHGGFTYKDLRLPFEHSEDTHRTWLGWDYAHYSDGYDLLKAKELFGDSDYLLMKYQHRFGSLYDSHLYTLDEVITECKYVIDCIVKE